MGESRQYLGVTPADTEPVVPVVAPPGPAVLPLHPPHQGAALTLTPLGIEPKTLTL